MAIMLLEATAGQEIPIGPFIDETDGITPMTGLTIANTDIKLWKKGATSLVNKNSGGATHMAGGVYYCTLDATDTGTIGSLVVFVHATGALPVRVECEVESTEFEEFKSGSAILDVNVLGTTTGAIDSASFASGAITADALASDAIDEIWDEALESTITARQFMRLILASTVNKSAGGGTSTVTFRDVADSKNRISATVDSNGNRTAVTRDGS